MAKLLLQRLFGVFVPLTVMERFGDAGMVLAGLGERCAGAVVARSADPSALRSAQRAAADGRVGLPHGLEMVRGIVAE